MKTNFRNLTYPELKAKRQELCKSYLEFRFNLVVGHVENPLNKRTMRRNIARLNTLISEQERSLAVQKLSAEVGV